MKKMLMTLAAIVTLGMSVLAADGNVDSQVLNAFKKDFASATEVTWTSGTDYHKVSFFMNGQKIFAFYSTEGELMGMTRYILSADLPLMLQTSLKKEYGNFWISDLFEVAKEDGTRYYATMEDADHKIILQSTDGNNWSVFRKSNKA
jgi:hypothetical protein